MEKIFIASDHAGFELKESLSVFLKERGIEVEDCGAFELKQDDDYPDYMFSMASKVAQNKGSYGIGIGASGEGEAMVANRIKGARAAVYYGPVAHNQTDASGNNLDILTSTRMHNNANILCIGSRFVREEEAKDAVLRWLQTPYNGEERHARRIAKFN